MIIREMERIFFLGQASEPKMRIILHLIYSSCSLKGVENFISSAHENLLTECHIADSFRQHELSWKSSGSFLDNCSPTPCMYVVLQKSLFPHVFQPMQ